MTRRPLFVVISIILVVGLVAWGVVALANSGERDTVTSQFAFLADEADPVPAELDLNVVGEGGVAADSVHVLGAHNGRYIYVGTDSRSNVCVIIFEPASTSSASSCGPPDGQHEFPLGVALRTGTGGIEVYLVPDDMVITQKPFPWEQVSANVLAIDTGTPTTDDIVVQLPDGETLSLPRVGPPAF